jgi:hypothetical protein
VKHGKISPPDHQLELGGDDRFFIMIVSRCCCVRVWSGLCSAVSQIRERARRVSSDVGIPSRGAKKKKRFAIHPISSTSLVLFYVNLVPLTSAFFPSPAPSLPARPRSLLLSRGTNPHTYRPSNSRLRMIVKGVCVCQTLAESG